MWKLPFAGEISMISKLASIDLNVKMRKVFDVDGVLHSDFCRKSILEIGDFVQLPSSAGWFLNMHGTCPNNKLTELTRTYRNFTSK